MKDKFAFLILHYCSIEETKKSIESIKENINYTNYDIVVVDNNSTNKTGDLLLEKYKNDFHVHIILNSENLGFAKGNNVGFKYAKETLKADYIIMHNNDVYMIQKDFCNKIIKEYEDSHFGVLGPKIIMRDGSICNYMDKMPSLNELKKIRRETYFFHYLNNFHLRYIYALYKRLKFKKKERINPLIRKSDVVLNGCCLIFSKDYISKFDGIDDRTFLYYEEPLLYIRLKKEKLISVYNPDLIVKHNESSSTRKISKNKRKVFKFVLKNELESLNILIKEIEQGDFYEEH